MGMFSRMSTIFKAKVSKALDKAEDPRETLDYSYEKQLEMLQKVKRGIVEVTTAKKRLELQLAKQKEDVTKMDGQARAALQQNREDLARVVLTRKASAMETLQTLEAQVANLDNEQAKLVDAESRLAAKVESFRTRKEVIKATYSAAEAQVRIGEAVSGIGEEMTDVGMAIDRAENKTAQLQAKASAIDELMVSGVLSDGSWGGSSGAGSDIDRELAKLAASSSVDSDLARMKSELGAGAPAPKQLEPGR